MDPIVAIKTGRSIMFAPPKGPERVEVFILYINYCRLVFNIIELASHDRIGQL